MKNEKKLKGYESVWTCDYCGKEFKTKKLSDIHELKCIKNPQNSRFLILIGVLVFIGIFFFVDSVVKAKEKSNFIPQQIQEPTPTITSTPTLIPKPKTQNTTNTNNNGSQIDCIGPDGKQFKTSMTECKNLAEKWGKQLNYMTNCELVGKCEGQVIRMSLIDCKNGNFACCHLKDNWQYFISDKACREKQGELGLATTSDKFILNYPKGSQYLCNTSNRSEIDSLFNTMTESLRLYSTSRSSSDLDRGIEAEKRLNTIIDVSCTKQ